MDNPTIITAIRSGGSDREKCLTDIYTDNFSLVYSMLKKHSLSKEEVMNAYADSITLFSDHVMKGTYKGSAKYSTFLFSILNNKCIDIIREKTTHKSKQEKNYVRIDHIKDHTGTDDDIVEKLTARVQWELLNRLMDRLRGKCKKILLDWNDGYSMFEIASRNGLLNEHTARTARYKCFRQLMQMVKGSRKGIR